MKRRNLLRFLGAASLTPLIPKPIMGLSASTATEITYSRYVYGLGVFHARTKASLSAAELMKSLSISQSQAQAMMGEMLSKGVVRAGNAPHVVHAVSQHMKPSPKANLKAIHDKFMELTDPEIPRDEAIDSEALHDLAPEKMNENQKEPLA